MTLTQRIQELLQNLCVDFPERESCLRLGFLAAVNNEPFYLYGRTGERDYEKAYQHFSRSMECSTATMPLSS